MIKLNTPAAGNVAPTFPLIARWSFLGLLPLLLLLSLFVVSSGPRPRPAPPPATTNTAPITPNIPAHATELTHLRTPFARHYDVGQGEFVAAVSLTPRHYQDATGAWQAIDPALQPTNNGWRGAHNLLQTELAADHTAVAITSKEHTFNWQPLALTLADEPLATPTKHATASQPQPTELSYAQVWSDSNLTEQIRMAPGELHRALVLDAPPTGTGEWLTWQLALSDLPSDVVFRVGNEVQSVPFTAVSPIEVYTAKGDYLFTLDPAVGQEVNQPEQAIRGQTMITQPASGDGFVVHAQTPLGWWQAPERVYPLALVPVMHVLKDLNAVSIRALDTPYDPEDDDPPKVAINQNPAELQPRICAGHTQHGVGDLRRLGVYRAYVKYPLPALPEGMEPTWAMLAAVPELHTFPNYFPDKISQQPTRLANVTADWESQLSGSALPGGWTFPAQEQPLASQIVYVPHPGVTVPPQPAEPVPILPATVWNISTMVKDWYANPANYYGFTLYPEYESFYTYEDILPHGRVMTRACFPRQPKWSTAPDPMSENPYADEAGMTLYIAYTASSLSENQFRTDTVPSAQPDGSYRYQYHEYNLPQIGNEWQLFAAQSAPTADGLDAKVPLDLVTQGGEALVTSDTGIAGVGNESYQWSPNYIAVNGRSAPGNLQLRVQPDTKPVNDHNSKLYYLQTLTAVPAPPLPIPGTTITTELSLFRTLIAGQELTFSGDTTVEIKVPYNSGGAGSANNAHQYDLRVFPPGIDYGTRQSYGMGLTRGPDAYEIEFSVSDAQAGDWLLVLNSNIRRTIVDFTAEITVCQNTDDVVRYPLDGDCLELRRPINLGNSQTTQLLGNLRIYNPAGFNGDCNTVCTTKEQDNSGLPVMPLLGLANDDNHWVAIKGGTLELDRNNNRIRTSPDARLVLADFSGQKIVSLPVLRGRYEVPSGSTDLERISAPNDTYLLVNSPLGEQDTAGWEYLIDLQADRLRASGSLAREIMPTIGESSATFTFDADWSITAVGGPSLDGDLTFNALTQSPIAVGTLLAQPPNTGYSHEYDPRDASAQAPAAIPFFRHIRSAGINVFQPGEMGAAKLALQAVLLPAGQSVRNDENELVPLTCGTHCFDLRGEEDAMTNNGALIQREYKMPDIIIQDSANTVIFNLPSGAEIYSSDHPMSRHVMADDLSFNYETFGASVRTFEGKCPGPRDPLDPNKQGPEGPTTTVVIGTATMSLPNLDSDSGDMSGGAGITVSFTLCSNSLREMSFTFSTGNITGIPIGSSGMFMHLIGGTISLSPQQQGQSGYTTVVLEVAFRGMSPAANTSNIFIKGIVTIDSRGLFDVQLQAGIRLVASIGLAVDGHFWVAWSPLDLGFEVEACVPYGDTYNQIDFPATLCQGNELLYGSLRMHVWQGQGWQNKYHWLPDNSDIHMAARFEAKITIGTGMIIDWGPAKVPPSDLTLIGIKLAFGEFCVNETCTVYEWGIMGALTVLGYDVGLYYGFDTGISFIMGSADFTLIDEFGTADFRPTPWRPPEAAIGDEHSTTLEIPAGVSSALFGLARYGAGNLGITLYEPAPGNRVITLKSTQEPDVTINIGTTNVGDQVSIAIDDPLPGTWRVELLAENVNPGDYRFFYFANPAPPEVEFEPLPGSVQDEESVTIEWTSNLRDDNESDMWLSLYYENFSRTYTQTTEIVGPIVERVPLGQAGSYEWALEGIPTGEYRLFGRLENGAATAVNQCGADYSYNPDPDTSDCNTMLAPGIMLTGDELVVQERMTIIDTVPPAVPQISNAYPEDDSSVVVRWSPNSEKDIAGYIVTCTQPGALVRQVRIPARLNGQTDFSETARVVGLNPTPATCTVAAYDSSSNVSADSSSVSATPTGNVPFPPAAVLQLNAPSIDTTAVLLQWQASAQASGYLIFVAPKLIDNDPDQMPSLLSNRALLDTSATGRPINVGDATSYNLTGLEKGMTYEITIRPYDADGRVGGVSAALAVTTLTTKQLYLPVISR